MRVAGRRNRPALPPHLRAGFASPKFAELKLKRGTNRRRAKNFLENYLNPAIADGYVKLLYPDSPRHPRQKYLLTVKGSAFIKSMR